MARRAEDLKGRTFGLLTVVRQAKDRNSSGALMWVCQCNCGNDKTATGSALRSGYTQSCGCLKRPTENLSETKHLNSRPKEISTIWLSMPLVGRSNQAIQEF